jgi:hypothetical protein
MRDRTSKLAICFITAALSACGGSDPDSSLVSTDSSNSKPFFVDFESPLDLSIAENTSVVTRLVGVDPAGTTLTYSLGGEDAKGFSISSSGLVLFRTIPDYELLSKTQFNITVTATNTSGLFVSGSLVINVTDVAEAFFDTCRFGGCKFE